MKEIKLSLGKVALVDDSDYDVLSKYKWRAFKNGNSYYARMFIYFDNWNKSVPLQMHRIIMGADSDKDIIDHKDCNGLNNQRNNLRLCTRTQNAYNKKKSDNPKSSKFKGVYLSTSENKWRALIQVKNQKISLGKFDDEISAAIAYNKKAIEIHGEFANLNVV